MRRNSIDDATDITALVVDDNSAAVSIPSADARAVAVSGSATDAKETGELKGERRKQGLVRRISNRILKHQWCPFWANRITATLAPITLLLFLIALGSSTWAVQNSGGVIVSIGLWQLTTVITASGSKESDWIDTYCRIHTEGRSSQLPNCSQFNAIRFFAIMAVLFMLVVCVLLAYNALLRGKVRLTVICRLSLCALVWGVLACGVWANWYMYEQGGRRSELSWAFAFSVLGSVTSAAIAVMVMWSSLGAT
jgi:hypothetical protein